MWIENRTFSLLNTTCLVKNKKTRSLLSCSAWL